MWVATTDGESFNVFYNKFTNEPLHEIASPVQHVPTLNPAPSAVYQVQDGDVQTSAAGPPTVTTDSKSCACQSQLQGALPSRNDAAPAWAEKLVKNVMESNEATAKSMEMIVADSNANSRILGKSMQTIAARQSSDYARDGDLSVVQEEAESVLAMTSRTPPNRPLLRRQTEPGSARDKVTFRKRGQAKNAGVGERERVKITLDMLPNKMQECCKIMLGRDGKMSDKCGFCYDARRPHTFEDCGFLWAHTEAGKEWRKAMKARLEKQATSDSALTASLRTAPALSDPEASYVDIYGSDIRESFICVLNDRDVDLLAEDVDGQGCYDAWRLALDLHRNEQ